MLGTVCKAIVGSEAVDHPRHQNDCLVERLLEYVCSCTVMGLAAVKLYGLVCMQCMMDLPIICSC